MVQRKGGFRRKTRYKLAKRAREKGKVPITAFLRRFETGDSVRLVANSWHQAGMYHPRFHGVVGKVQGMQGTCYKVEIRDGNKRKVLVVHPVHLRNIQ